MAFHDQVRNRACFQPTAPESEAGPIPVQVAEKSDKLLGHFIVQVTEAFTVVTLYTLIKMKVSFF